MARDPLQVLRALRRHAVEQARYALGTCLQAEAAVADRIDALDDAARRNHATGAAWPDAHQFLEMAAMRATALRAERQAAQADLATVTARSGEARAVVTAARTEAEAVEQFIGERSVTARAASAKREQHVLDDITRVPRGAMAGAAGHPDGGDNGAGATVPHGTIPGDAQ